MIPSEKAKQLIERFIEPTKVPNPKMIWVEDRNAAKHCALICVNEIIKSNPQSNPLNTDPIESTMGYWMEVKSALEKL